MYVPMYIQKFFLSLLHKHYTLYALSLLCDKNNADVITKSHYNYFSIILASV